MKSNRAPLFLAAVLGLLLCFSIGYAVMHAAPTISAPADSNSAARISELQSQVVQLQAKIDFLEAEDILLADFEGPDYGTWTTTGTAFGKSPAQGTLNNQNWVAGYLGHGLVNSFFDGDEPTGTLTSQPFKIERRYISFLIGGGNHPDSTCINLLIDGKVTLTATAKNDEHLDWASWNVTEYLGKMATIQIVDHETGGWGHINIDQITESQNSK